MTRPHDGAARAGASTPARSVLLRAVFFAGVWWTLTAGAPRSWIVGAPVVALATGAAIALSGPRGWTLNAAGVAAFVPYFLWRSMWGSADVAWRAMHPRVPIAPAFERFVLRLPAEGPARVFFANTMNLLPGMLNARIHDDVITVHLLNAESPAAVPELRRLERKVAALFGLRLAPAAAAEEPPDA